ncbi:membrane protein DedA with SNARE-associated domain [Deinococcus metalli]|uniref:Alkaline phosphatase n=1 Tax=Deinococcus metalli TaxID=1141878 RepID=A0A7W8KI90_9DEIO|nr:VTT domain-containing protein [Deinococcus metalli]MBB5378672.1 membrane protein DedA with SNARE-associated domain [Deinococcus metalli]GHF61583.1 alkaline phosphatase [Deinococcus metalli]
MTLFAWVGNLDPTVLNAATAALLALEGAGIPGIPGVLPMLAQGRMIHAGQTTLAAAITWGVLGNWTGSLLGYATWRWGARWLPDAWRARVAGERTASLLARSGPGLIVVSRSLGSLRTPVTVVAGTSGYPLARYAALSLLGAGVHVGVWQTLLWKVGPALLPQVARWGRELVIVVAVIAVSAWFGKCLVGRRQRVQAGPPAEPNIPTVNPPRAP